MADCPTCGKGLGTEMGSTFPFCSERCRMADLDRWFTEDYRVPAEPTAMNIPDPDEG